MQNIRFGFIGTGNMGGALVRAAAKAMEPAELVLSNFSALRAQALSDEVDATLADNLQIAKRCDYIFLGVKPKAMASMLGEIAHVLRARTDRFVLVSMAAGLSISDIRQMAGGDYPVIRIMPNTPVASGEGMVLYTCSENVTSEDVALLLDKLDEAGQFDVLPESLMDAGSALSGCGPAFVCLFLEAFADAGVECGLPRGKAMLYAAQTLKGTAQLFFESGKHPGELKDDVCSPGGSTIAGVHALESNAFRGAVMTAVQAAYEKTKRLK